jgi:hypothetical protein
MLKKKKKCCDWILLVCNYMTQKTFPLRVQLTWKIPMKIDIPVKTTCTDRLMLFCSDQSEGILHHGGPVKSILTFKRMHLTKYSRYNIAEKAIKWKLVQFPFRQCIYFHGHASRRNG